MSTDPDVRLPHFVLVEYFKLKDEQIKRIEYRDHMVHVHLALVGGAVGWALVNRTYLVLLVVPWICIAIGWAYLVNDDRIGAIGNYIRTRLASRGGETCNLQIDRIFEWERHHRADSRRAERKRIQLAVDELTFVLPGILALALYRWFKAGFNMITWVMWLASAAIVLLLGYWFYRYADLRSEQLCGTQTSGNTIDDK